MASIQQRDSGQGLLVTGNSCLSVLQALLPILAKKGIVPNLRTFCNLAIGCHKPKDGMQLLADMKVRGPGPSLSRQPTILGEPWELSGRKLWKKWGPAGKWDSTPLV